MKKHVAAMLFLSVVLQDAATAQPSSAPTDDSTLRVVLLGTASGPSIQAQRLGIFGATPKAMLKAFDDAGKELPGPLKETFEKMRKAREEASVPSSGGGAQ